MVALDAVTLERRARFGEGLFKTIRGLAVAGDELFVCDILDARHGRESALVCMD